MSTKTTPKAKTYPKGEQLTVVWEAHKCIHAENCIRGLPGVFDMNARPWINVDGADAEAIQRQIDQCPSGALSYQSPNQNENWTMDTKTQTQAAQVSIITNGPMKVSAPVIIERDGEEKQHDKDVFLCRCGASSGKPYCDGSHKKVGFEG